MEFRTLRADEIECRVATVNQNGCSLLLYKDSRADMILLDETVGSMNWKREHARDNANCIVSIWDKEKEQWINKEDTGTESYTEKEKGLASDSFKRACVNWGIGRELYTAPFIWVNAANSGIKESEFQGKKKYTTYERFDVVSIAYKDRKISGLVIANSKTKKVVYTFGNTKPEEPVQAPDEKIDVANQKIGQAKINTIRKELERTGVNEMAICKRYKVETLENITEELFIKVMNALAKTKSKE